MNTNFSCSVPMRNCDLGLLPASNHAISSSRVSIGVMSTWSRAMRRFRRKGPRPYTAPTREGNWPMLHAQPLPAGPRAAAQDDFSVGPGSKYWIFIRAPNGSRASSSTLGDRLFQHLADAHDLAPHQIAKFVRRGGGEKPALLADFAAHLARVQDRQGPFAENPHDRLWQAGRSDQAEPHVQIDIG